ncbi:MAG: hypothetical protein FWH18_07340 [Marinilabiliaceae bacterium]|nr:hypothetical protein [Marinilabiliaceae bacterium]
METTFEKDHEHDDYDDFVVEKPSLFDMHPNHGYDDETVKIMEEEFAKMLAKPEIPFMKTLVDYFVGLQPKEKIKGEITLYDHLPKNEEDIIDYLNICPYYKRLKDYFEEIHPLEELACSFSYENEKILIYAACLCSFVHTKFCTNKNNRDVLYLADEIAMKAATDYIDDKVKGIFNYDKPNEDEDDDDEGYESSYGNEYDYDDDYDD